MNNEMLVRMGKIIRILSEQITMLNDQIAMLSAMTREQTEMLSGLDRRITELEQVTPQVAPLTNIM